MMMWVQSKNIGTVVTITRIEKRKVQIGSAIYQSGLTLMMIAAAMTPKL